MHCKQKAAKPPACAAHTQHSWCSLPTEAPLPPGAVVCPRPPVGWYQDRAGTGHGRRAQGTDLGAWGLGSAAQHGACTRLHAHDEC
eukprot:363968-Chlamydomonas_euryale.AAC.7